MRGEGGEDRGIRYRQTPAYRVHSRPELAELSSSPVSAHLRAIRYSGRAASRVSRVSLAVRLNELEGEMRRYVSLVWRPTRCMHETARRRGLRGVWKRSVTVVLVCEAGSVSVGGVQSNGGGGRGVQSNGGGGRGAKLQLEY